MCYFLPGVTFIFVVVVFANFVSVAVVTVLLRLLQPCAACCQDVKLQAFSVMKENSNSLAACGHIFDDVVLNLRIHS